MIYYQKHGQYWTESEYGKFYTEYQYGKPHGTFIQWYPNSEQRKQEQYFHNGYRCGLHFKWDQDGNLVETLYYNPLGKNAKSSIIKIQRWLRSLNCNKIELSERSWIKVIDNPIKLSEYDLNRSDTTSLVQKCTNWISCEWNSVDVVCYENGDAFIKPTKGVKNLYWFAFSSEDPLRKFRIRKRGEKGYRDIDGLQNKVIIMCGDFHKEYTYEMPKTKRCKNFVININIYHK